MGSSFHDDLEAALAASMETLAEEHQLRQSGVSCSTQLAAQPPQAYGGHSASGNASFASGDASAAASPVREPAEPCQAMQALCEAATATATAVPAPGKRLVAEGQDESGAQHPQPKRRRRKQQQQDSNSLLVEEGAGEADMGEEEQQEGEACSAGGEGSAGPAGAGDGGSSSSHLPAGSSDSHQPLATAITEAEVAAAQQRRQQHLAVVTTVAGGVTTPAPLLLPAPVDDQAVGPMPSLEPCTASGQAGSSGCGRIYYPGQLVFHCRSQALGGERVAGKVLSANARAWPQPVYTIELAGGAGYAEALPSALHPRPLPRERCWVRAGGSAVGDGTAGDGGATTRGGCWLAGVVESVVDDPSWAEPMALVDVAGEGAACWPLSRLLLYREIGESSSLGQCRHTGSGGASTLQLPGTAGGAAGCAVDADGDAVMAAPEEDVGSMRASPVGLEQLAVAAALAVGEECDELPLPLLAPAAAAVPELGEGGGAVEAAPAGGAGAEDQVVPLLEA